MSSLRFVHAADLHLDTPFEGIAGPAPAVARALQEASLQAWDNLVRLTVEREAAFLLLAGDIYDGAQRGMRAQLRFVDGLKRLSAAGVLTFVVHGNHDPLDGWSAVKEWPVGVTVFGSDAVQTVEARLEAQDVHVHGISYRTRDVQDNLAASFRRSASSALNIGLLHTNACASAEHAPYAPCTLSDLDAAGMDYWALGHIHQRRFLREGPHWIAYSGNTQGRSPKPSETGAKGALVVEASAGAVHAVQFEPVDVVRFVTCAVDIAEASDAPSLQTLVVRSVDDLRREHEGRSLLVRVVLEGRGPAAGDLLRDSALAEFTGELRGAYEGLDPFVWIEAVKDRARGALDRDALRKRGDFAAELLKLSDGLVANPEAVETFVDEAAVKLRSPGQVERALRDLERDVPEDVLAEALELALDRLETEADR